MNPEPTSLEQRESDAEGRNRLLKTLTRIQRDLRTSLLDELLDAEETIEQGLFDVSSYSDQYEHYKYRFLDRLDTLRRLIHELNVLDKSRREHKSELLVAATLPELNAKLQRRVRALDGATSIVALEIEKAPPPRKAVKKVETPPPPTVHGSRFVVHGENSNPDHEPQRHEPRTTNHEAPEPPPTADAAGDPTLFDPPAATEAVALPAEVWYALIVTASWRAVEE